MTDADKVMNPQHFGSELTVIAPKSGNPDWNCGSLSVAILSLAEVYVIGVVCLSTVMCFCVSRIMRNLVQAVVVKLP